MIGWTREGLDGFADTGIAVLLSKDRGGSKWMFVGKRHVGREWKHYVDNELVVEINADGWAKFTVSAGELGVWIPA